MKDSHRDNFGGTGSGGGSNHGQSPPKNAKHPQELAEYIGEMLDSLGELAGNNGMEFLSGLIELAALEARKITQDNDNSADPPQA